ncbi:LysR family transcriptional regulator [Jannaschia sp. LMIT008]|uniref:LysR family transcriptional regulator n=1 Tax=Jannaschia maritima TaxID=3032585 RepID=UPI00281165EE|nr:LysR family transcriptional regulator [Jannaschia sp. LMIT008]
MTGLNYNHLRYFQAVAHDGNLTRAAVRLNLSQSAVSLQIRKLEDRLGHPLFERRGRRLHLTEAGRIALDHADAIFAAGDELLDTLRDRGQARQVLRVGALATLSRNFLVGFLRPVLGRGDVRVTLRSGGQDELLAALDGLNLDVVLTNRPPLADERAPAIVHRLTEQSVSLVGTPALVAGATDLRGWLDGVAVVLPTPGSGIRAGFDAMADRMRLSPRIAAEADDMATLRLLAREGLGLAVVPPIVVRDELASGTLVEAAALDGIRETFFAVTPKRRFPNAALAEILDAAAS